VFFLFLYYYVSDGHFRVASLLVMKDEDECIHMNTMTTYLSLSIQLYYSDIPRWIEYSYLRLVYRRYDLGSVETCRL
jgi:hypothetical protein